MAFDPDKYLAEKTPAFDPDAYLASTPAAAAPVEAEKPEDQSIFRQVADVPLQFGTGIAQGVRAITDSFGANNAVSQNIRGVEGYLSGLLSAQAKQDKQEVARIFQEAEDQGLGSQLAAGLRALAVSPVDFLAQGLGTAVPTIAGGLAGAALKGGTLAARAATAARVGTGLGAVSGTGIVKSTIYDEVKRELSALGLPEDLVEERAKLAQEYGGENLDQILLGAGLGALAAGTGLEKVLSSRILKNVAASNAAESGALRSALFAGAKEGAPEFIQAAQEQIAGNVALQREGFEDIPTMRGVATAAALEGAIGFGLGAGIDVALPAQQQQQYDAARANITNEVDIEREILLRADEQKRFREFASALERENQRRLAGQDQQVNIDAEAAAVRTRAADIAIPNQDEVNELAAPMRGVDVSNDVQFGVAYGQKIARTLGDYFPNFGQFSVTQGETVIDQAGEPQPTFTVIDTEGNRYGQPLRTFEQANATAYSLNKEVINQNVRGAILNSLETSGQSYDPETTQRLFSYGYRTLNPDANLFSTVAINEAAKTFGPEYAEALSWRQVEALPEVKDRRGRRIGFEYTVQGQQPRIIKGLTKAQEMNKARSQEGKPESNTFDLQETKSALGKSFAAITKDVPIDPKIGKQGAINQIKSLLQSKNVSSEIDSLEINALAKGLTGKNSVNDMDYGDIRLFAKKLAGLPRFEKPVKLPEFVFKPYNRENFVKASKFLQQSNAQGAKPDRDQILEAAGISKEDPKVDEKFSALETDLAKQGVRNEPQKPLALPAPPGGDIDLESLRKALRAKLKGFGLQDINLSLERNLIKPTGEIAPAETEAMFIPAMRQVFLAVDRIDPDGSLTPEQRLNALSEVMGHEIIHAVRLLDLWKPDEWSSLEKPVARIQKPGTNQTYLQIAQRNYADQNAVVQIEEAVADMYRDYVGKRLKIAGKPQNLLERLAQFFQRLRSALAGTGFQTYGDVINRLESGVIGARQRGEVRTLRATEEAVAEAGRIPERLRDIITTPQGRQQVRQQTIQQSVPAAATTQVTAPVTSDFNTNVLTTAAIRESRSLTDPVPQTIDVDDRNVPTRDSEGRLIYSGSEGSEVFNIPTRPTMDGLRNFWNWFGSSKAVDNSKRPLVYYHGTAADITAFQPKQAGSVFLTRSPRFAEEFSALSEDYMVSNFPDFMSDQQVLDAVNETLQSVSSFTPAVYDKMAAARDQAAEDIANGKAIRPAALKVFKSSASTFSGNRYLNAIQKRIPSSPNVMPVYVRAEKPWDYNNPSDIKAVVKRARDNGADITASMVEEIGQGNWQTIEGSDGNAPILDAIRELGYDSMFVEEGGQKNLAVFDPGQIKSAIGNNGDFSPLTTSIRESRRSPNVVGLMSGEEVPPRKLKGKTQVAQYLQDRALEALGGRARDLNNEADRDAIADDLVEEAIYEMEAQKNALEWYDTTIERTIELLSLKYPEIKTDQNARTAFLTGLAITSQNIAVPDNLKYAEEVYNYFKRNRRFPEKGFGSKAGSIKRNFEKANMLIDSLGSMEAFTDFLQTEFTVGQLNPILKEHLGKGAKVGGELVGAKVYGSAVFGPKIGNGFYTNLRGDFSPVTIDMWFMRTIGRLRGKVMDFEESKFGKQLNRLAKSENMEGASTDELVARATQLAKQHEKDFKQFRSEYDSGVRKKSEATNAAITIVKSLKATRDAPSTGREREQLRDIVNRAINKMRDRTGQDIPPAAFQALIWYPEQDLYKKLGVNLKHVRQDYANSTKQFLRNEGFSERELKRSEDRVRSRRQRRTERVRPGAVAPVEAAVAPTGRRIGEAVPGAEAAPLIRESRRPQAQLDQAVANAEADVASTPSMAVPLYNPGASPEALYVAQNPEQGLKLTPEEKIRYSRNNQPQYQPGVQQILDKLTKDPPAQTPAQTVITSMQMPRFRDTIDKMRQNLIFNYSRLEFYNKAHPSLMHNTAAVSSLAAAEFADRSKALFAAAVKGGVPVYKNGGFTIEPFVHNGREYKNGLIDVLAPLYNNPYGVSLEKLAQGYAIARRGQRLTREGKLVPGDPADFPQLLSEVRRYTNPETGNSIIEDWYDTWQAYNSNTVKFLRDTGMIDDAGAQLWLSQSDYFPFYRTDKTGKDISHPKVFGGLTSVTNLKALKGGEEAIDVSLMEAILTNLDSAIAMGMKNVAQQRIVRDMITIGLGRMVQPGENIEGRPAVTFKVGGKKYSAFIDDTLIFESMQAVPEVNMDNFLGNLFRVPAQILRELIVRDPGYVVANMLRDTASVVLTSGSNIIPVVDTVKNFGRGLENLEKFGVVGGYDFARDPGDVVKFASDEARKRGHEFPVKDETKWDQVVNSNYIRPLTRVWDGLGKISDMAEASTRNAVYEDTMSRTGNWVQAAYDALSVINYGRRGRNAGLRVITASVPFLNARIQGLDKLYQAATGRSGVFPERKKNILRFVTRAGLMVGLTGLYYAMVSDDELYENENPEVRDNYYIIPIKKADLANREPGFAFKIPIPFEVGILFKTIPERIMDAYYKDAPSKDLKDSLFRATTSTLGFNPVPQVVLPIFETVANYDTFTGRSIIPQYMQDRDPIAQSRFGTNELARRLGEAAGISPLKLDHLMNGYLGSLGTYTLDTVDSVLRDNDRAYPERKWFEYPFVRRFFTTAMRPGLQEQFYELDARVNGVVQSMNTLRKENRVDELQTYIMENQNILALKEGVNVLDKMMKNYRDQKNMVLRMDIDPEEKRRIVDELDRSIALQLKIMPELRRYAYDEQRQTRQ
jgi:hypothetical protein